MHHISAGILLSAAESYIYCFEQRTINIVEVNSEMWTISLFQIAPAISVQLVLLV